MIKNSIALTVAATVFMTGCSAMFPYRDDFQCEKGKNSGVCASVSEVYEMSFDMDTLKKKKLNQEEEGCEECGDKDVKKENIGKPIGIDINATENQRLKEIVEAIEIKKLQDGRPIIIQNNNSNGIDSETKQNIQKMIVSKMSSGSVAGAAASTGGNMNKSITQGQESIDCSKVSGDDVVHTLNQDVKVCVYNANIRKNPSCTADIVRVAKKDEVLYAEYEKNGWVKTNDGYIHKSIITQK